VFSVAKHKIEKGEKMKTETFKTASKNVIARSPFGTTKQSQLPRGLRAHPTRRDCRAALAMTSGIKNGFTLAELLTAIAIIAILIGILMPALNMARKFANDTKQKAMLASIETGILMFKNDTGEYPPSHGYNKSNLPTYADYDYCGAQTLAEALVGYDLLGVHKNTIYTYDGENPDVTPQAIYDLSGLSDVQVKENLAKRKGPYLSRENIGVFYAKDIFKQINNGTLKKDNYLICDVYTVLNKTITLPNNSQSPNKFKMGTPILYFRANTAMLEIDSTDPEKSIYNFWDNQPLVELGKVADNSKKQVGFLEGSNDCKPFYSFIEDPIASITTRIRPVRPDSFLLISAGADGFYGTTDDICNFTPNIQ